MHSERETNIILRNAFEAADWLWSFRWLAVVLFVCAALGSTYILWADQTGSAVEAPRGYDVTIDLHMSGTPVRSIAEVADLFGYRLSSPDLIQISSRGTNPVVLRTKSHEAAEATLPEIQSISNQLAEDVRAQADFLASYMRSENVAAPLAAQYMQAMAFLKGIESGVVVLARPTIKEVNAIVSARAAFLLPWIAAVLLFLMIAGVITFLSEWRSYRQANIS